MKVFVLYLSEDGLFQEYATNAKSLFEMIRSSGYGVDNIEFPDRNNGGDIQPWEKVPFNYRNLVKAMKLSSSKKYYSMFHCTTPYGFRIRVNELGKH